MRFRILVRDKGENNEWWEDYDKPVTNLEKWGKEIVEWFNNTRLSGEAPREFIRAELLGVGKTEHDWEKQNAFTQNDRLSSYDNYRCRKCGITGKRRGLSHIIERDPIFRAKVYIDCEKGKAHKKKVEARRRSRNGKT